ncbi:MAG: hypothetical protein BJ554DRAFT_8275 [Olpidium bornovanus]|uniref:Protein kinase domain-containing protein n=1 Tax=Olpidium bornovanus TaxID=278681 RepID=A0A8H7ZV86_9FUNG|nr:MAG: hypothetical protein BJ554DRAFT_8275 [Olpidium bornovanus]
MWAVGCIIAELHLGKPLFPGVDEYHQLELITSALGSPGADDLDGMRNSKSRRCLSSIGQKPAQPWRTIVPSADSQGRWTSPRLRPVPGEPSFRHSAVFPPPATLLTVTSTLQRWT